MEKKHIVILGAGFAGISTYLSIPKWVRKTHKITIINKENYFLFTPLIHEVATGALNAYHVTEPIRKLIDQDVCFIQNTVESVDVENKKVSLIGEIVSYDILVVALGSKTNFFNTKGAEEFAHALKDLSDAKKIRNHFLDIFEAASREKDIEKRKKMLKCIIIGGGPTGVELAAESAELFFDTFQVYYKNSIDFSEVQLTIINSGDSLLKPFSKRFQEYAEKILISKNINIVNNTRVVEIKKDSVIINTQSEIFAGTIIWTAGVQAHDLQCSKPLKEIKGCLCVNEYLHIPEHKDIFVIGDIAHFPTKDGRGLPMLAQVAKQQGIATGKNIGRLLLDKDLQKFSYTSRGNLASLGQWHAIADLHVVGFTGPFAWFIWRTIYLHNFASWRKRFKITIDWTVNLFSRRDITRS